MYGVLGWLSMRAARPGGWRLRAGVLTFAAVSLFGAVDEWHQQFIPGRSSDGADWLADTAGAGLGILATAATRRREQPT